MTILPIDAARLQDWQGEYKFFWRAKIKALEFVGAQHPDIPLVCLDTDTLLHDPLAELSQTLSAGTAFMHEPEGCLAALTSKTDRRMWQRVQGHYFGGVIITRQHQMWNTGVVAIPAQRQQEAIGLALAICDGMSARQVTPRLIEQFTLSVALSETYAMQEARPYIGHYWSTKKEWNESIGTFLLESHLKQRDIAADIAALEHFDFQLNPVKKKTPNTHHRVNRLLNKIMLPRDVEFIAPKRP